MCESRKNTLPYPFGSSYPRGAGRARPLCRLCLWRVGGGPAVGILVFAIFYHILGLSHISYVRTGLRRPRANAEGKALVVFNIERNVQLAIGRPRVEGRFNDREFVKLRQFALEGATARET